MKITVAGTGYVGLVTGVCLAELGHHVTCIDIQSQKIEMLQSSLSPIYEPGLEPLLIKNQSNSQLNFTTNPHIAYAQAEIIFITVGTPEKEDGTADLQYIENVCLSIAEHIENDVIICTKSTVPVGTNEKIKQIINGNKLPYIHIDVISNPEFLREGSAIFDFYHGDRIVIGAENVCLSIAEHIENDVIICTKSTVPVGTNEKIKQIINGNKLPYIHIDVISNPEFLREGSAIFDFYHGDRIVIGADNPEAVKVMEQLYLPLGIPLIKTDIKSAEMIKYASNAFLATKISFINEIAALCEKVGANIDEVSYGIGQDKRIGPHFLQAGIGYGGSCFPKDTKALAKLAGNVQHSFELLNAVIEVNNRQQSLPVLKAKELFGSLLGKKVTVLGLSFKPKTDDIREAASLQIINGLLNESAIVTAYDPIAITNAKKVFGNQITYTDDIRDALMDSELAIIATEWDQIKSFPLHLYELYMKEAIIIDGRNCLPLHEMINHSIHYISIGRSSRLPTFRNK